MNIQFHHNQYRTKGWSLLPLVMSEADCELLADHVQNLSYEQGERVDGYAPLEDNTGAPYPPEIMDEGELYAYDYVSSDVLLSSSKVRGLAEFYESLVHTLTQVTREAVTISPYPKSRVLGVNYNRVGDCQGYHRDTQPITALLYLTDSSKGAKTRIHDFTGKEYNLAPPAGTLLVMQGRHIRHCSTPLTQGRKVVLPMNYYTTVDQWRPGTLDKDDYWLKAKETA